MTLDLPAWTPAEPGGLSALPFAPGSSGVIALVATEGAMAEGWAAEVALELAGAWSAKGARLVLADGGLEVPSLHAAAGLPLGEGLVDALRWGASVRRIARRLEGTSFFVITAGTATADGLAILEDPRWAALCGGFGEAGVTLAVLVPVADPCVRGILAEATAAVILATPSEDAADVLPGWDRPILGVVGREPPPPPEANEAPAATEPAEPLPTDATDPFPVREALTGLADPGEAPPTEEPAGFSVDAPELPEAPPEPEQPLALDPTPEPEEPTGLDPTAEPEGPPARDEPPVPVDVAPAELPGGPLPEPLAGPREPEPTGTSVAHDVEVPEYVQERKSRGRLLPLLSVVVLLGGAGGAWWLGYLDIPGIPRPAGNGVPPVHSEAPSAGTAAAAPDRETSPLMGFSVSLGSYRDRGTAEARISELAARVPGVLFTIVPVTVGGEVVHRVLAGPAADSTEAIVLGARIAEVAGLPPSDWVARATPRAFELGEMPELDAALRRSEVLRGLGIPSYVLAVSYDDGSVRFRVYAGAYADEIEASYLSGLLQERGLSSATLSDRIGRLPE